MTKTIPWWQPQLTGKESLNIQKVLDANYLNEGKFTEEFEIKIAELLRVKYAVAVTNGTAALFLALAAAGITYNDEVIIPDISFIATANAVKLAGATPVLVDVEKNSLTLDPQLFEKAITKRTKAVIPVHLSGRAADMKNISKIAAKYHIVVIEDAAEAFMSKYSGKFLGTLGDLGCFSFSPNKTITTGQGGIIVTNNLTLATKLRQLKDHGRATRGTGGEDEHPVVGYNFKLTNLQAAVGLAQLDALKKRLSRQKRNYLLYKKFLDGIHTIKLLPFNIGHDEIPQWVDAYAEKRDDLISFLKTKKIFCQPFWHPLHTQIPYHLPNIRFPVSSKITPHLLWLPSAFTLKDKDVFTVCQMVKIFYST